MGASTLIVEELASRIASRLLGGAEESRITPVLNTVTHDCDGLLIDSPLERIMVFGREQAMSLADVSHMRRTIAKVQARRAFVYVPADCAIPKSIALLATLSKIQIVRLTALDRTH